MTIVGNVYYQSNQVGKSVTADERANNIEKAKLVVKLITRQIKGKQYLLMDRAN